MIGFNNGKFQEIESINIPITSMSINRGYGAFEFFEVINNTPFYGDLHIARFLQTLKLLKLSIDFEAHLFDIIMQLIEYNDLDDFYFKLFALPHFVTKDEKVPCALYIIPTEMPQFSSEVYLNGGSLLLKEYRRFLPMAKSTSYLAGQFWQHEMDKENAIDVLYYNGKTVQETSRGNIFVVKSGVVTTPYKNVLKGITRGIILDILQECTHPFNEQEVTIEEVLAADEIFITSTTKQIIPIVVIDGLKVGSDMPGPITQELMMQFQLIKSQFRE